MMDHPLPDIASSWNTYPMRLRVVPIVCAGLAVSILGCSEAPPRIRDVEYRFEQPWFRDGVVVEFEEGVDLFGSGYRVSLRDPQGLFLDAWGQAYGEEPRVYVFTPLASEEPVQQIAVTFEDQVFDLPAFESWSVELHRVADDAPGPPTIVGLEQGEAGFYSDASVAVAQTGRGRESDRELFMQFRTGYGWWDKGLSPLRVIGEPHVIANGSTVLVAYEKEDDGPSSFGVQVFSGGFPYWNTANVPDNLRGRPRISANETGAVLVAAGTRRIQAFALNADSSEWVSLPDITSKVDIVDARVAHAGPGRDVLAYHTSDALHVMESRDGVWVDGAVIKTATIEGALSLATDGERVYLAWTELADGRPVVRIADISNEQATLLASPAGGSGGSRAPVIDVDANGVVHGAWSSLAEGDASIEVARYADDVWTVVGQPWISADPALTVSFALWDRRVPVLAWRDGDWNGTALYNGPFD